MRNRASLPRRLAGFPLRCHLEILVSARSSPRRPGSRCDVLLTGAYGDGAFSFRSTPVQSGVSNLECLESCLAL